MGKAGCRAALSVFGRLHAVQLGGCRAGAEKIQVRKNKGYRLVFIFLIQAHVASDGCGCSGPLRTGTDQPQ